MYALTPTLTRAGTVAAIKSPPAHTLTPLPTIPSDDVAMVREELVDGNFGCRLPCVWGATPGYTTWSTSRPFFESLMATIEKGSELTIEMENGQRVDASSIYIFLTTNEQGNRYGVRFTVLDDLVSLIFLGAESGGDYLHLEDIVEKYGPPTDVHLETRASPAPFGHPFNLLLIFSDQTFMLKYETEGELTESSMRGCFTETIPQLWSWSGHHDWLSERALNEAIGHEMEDYQPLEEVTDLTVWDLAREFAAPAAQLCLENPRTRWK